MHSTKSMKITISFIAAMVVFSFMAVLQAPAEAGDSIALSISRLKSADPLTREEAAEALGQSRDPRALEPLLEVLQNQSENGQVRMDAATALGSLGDTAAVEPLIAFIRVDMEKRTGIMAAAIGALGELKDPRAVPILLKALNNREEDWLYREMAARALGRIGDPGAVDDLISASWMGDTRHDAICALAQIGDLRAVETLIGALDEGEEPETVQAAMSGLVKIGAPAVPALIKTLKDFSKEYPMERKRAFAAQILGELGDRRAVGPLKKALEDQSAPVRQSARQALDMIVNR